MDHLLQSLLLATLAGAPIPLGAWVARWEHIRPQWLETEFRHTVIAFGGGVLLAAVALVLVPEGLKTLNWWGMALAFSAGGLMAMAADRWIHARGGAAAQFLAMLLDFVPEAMALGAMLAAGKPAGPLLALLIGFQNLPEGFNAYREIIAGKRHSGRRILWVFTALVLLGPLSAAAGEVLLARMPVTLGTIMLVAAGGILYLTFQDIAPQAYLRRHWVPPLGAIAGFLVGLLGHVLLG